MKKFLFRFLVVVCWISLIFTALYWSKLPFSSYQTNTINILGWGDILDPKIIAGFEKETGIKVNFNYYASNEELLVKLKATKGAGYDLIIPSDYSVKNLSKEHLLKKIDHSRLNFWNKINPNLLGRFFDPKNEYSIPFEWEIFLFSINKDYFAQKSIPHSWRLIFDPSLIDYKISMTNDPIEAIQFASLYLFGPKTSLTTAESKQVKELLSKQRSWVEAYASFRGDYFLATGSCQVAVASSSYLWRTLKLFPSIGFIIPEEGTFITIENLAIPSLSKNEALTYQLINYLFRKESVLSHFETFGFFPSTLDSLQDIPMTAAAKILLNSSKEQFSKFYFTQEIIPQQQMNDLWVEVKSGRY